MSGSSPFARGESSPDGGKKGKKKKKEKTCMSDSDIRAEDEPIAGSSWRHWADPASSPAGMSRFYAPIIEKSPPMGLEFALRDDG